MIKKLKAEIDTREREHKESIRDIMHPSTSLLCKLGSIVVHAEEGLAQNGHHFDLIALRGLTEDPEVAAWLKGMQASAFLPVKRNG